MWLGSLLGLTALALAYGVSRFLTPARTDRFDGTHGDVRCADAMNQTLQHRGE